MKLGTLPCGDTWTIEEFVKRYEEHSYKWQRLR